MQATATGQTSGLTASATFTDAINLVSYEDSGRTIARDAFAWGSTVFAQLSGQSNTKCYKIEWRNPSNSVVQSNTFTSAGNIDDSFNIAASGPSGVWTINVYEGPAGGACTFGAALFSRTFDVARAVIIGAVPSGGAGGDNNVNQNQPTVVQNDNSGTTLSIDSKSNANKRIYVQFDLTGSGISGTVGNAKFRMRVKAAPGARTHEAHGVTGTWLQNTITWNNAPPFISLSDSQSLSGVLVNALVRWFVTSDVQGFVNNPSGNHGWCVIDSSESAPGNNSGSYHATEANTATDKTLGPVLLVDYTPCAVVASSTNTAILCNGGSATVTVSATGGTPPYSGTGTFSHAAGTYSYTVTDANGCTATTTGNISQPTQLSASETHNPISCYGGTTTVNITASGGTPPYSGDGAQSGVSAGPFSFTVTDANGCSTVVSGNISQPTQLSASETHNPILCYGGTTTVNITASGGTPPYSGDGAQSGVSAGPFSFTVTDANGCSTVVSGNISQPTQLSASETHNPISCYGGTTTVNITASGGTPPYSGDGAQSGVSAGPFSFTVTDANGCSTVVSGNISQPTQLSASETHNPISCYGGTTTVNITASGGTPPYSGDGAQSGVSAGPFSFTVTDANGCSTVVSGNISQPTQLSASETHNPILCYGGHDNGKHHRFGRHTTIFR